MGPGAWGPGFLGDPRGKEVALAVAAPPAGCALGAGAGAGPGNAGKGGREERTQPSIPTSLLLRSAVSHEDPPPPWR